MSVYRQFNRIASVSIGALTNATALSIDGLRITFDIQKTRTSVPNSAKIHIYNLSESTYSSILANKQKVVLRAGYKEDLSQGIIFAGDIIRTYTEIKPPDIVTVIEALDGRKTGLVKISAGYPPGTTADTVMKNLTEQSGAVMNSLLPENVRNRVYKNGVSFSTTLKDAMDKAANFTDSEWSIQNEEMSIIEARSYRVGTVVQISAKHGMLESPVKVSNVATGIGLYKRKKNSGDIDVFPGWKVKNLLLPKILPADGVTIDSKFIPKNSLFTVWSVTHKGDTWGEIWETELEVSEVEAKSVNNVDKDPPPSFKETHGVTRDIPYSWDTSVNPFFAPPDITRAP